MGATDGRNGPTDKERTMLKRLGIYLMSIVIFSLLLVIASPSTDTAALMCVVFIMGDMTYLIFGGNDEH